MKIQADKVGHLLVGFVLTLAVVQVAPPAAAMLVCAVVAWCKEEYDRRHPESHTFDGWDAYATVYGGCLGLIADWLWAALRTVL